jgi:hypothetical protein
MAGLAILIIYAAVNGRQAKKAEKKD